jgi:hypothetical protein
MVLAGTIALLASFGLNEELRTLNLVALGGMFVVLVLVTIVVIRRWTILTTR